MNQPQTGDAVLGGQSLTNQGGASQEQWGNLVLGGLPGVQWRLQSPYVEQRVQALQEALNYGEPGLKLVILALQDASSVVEEAAAALLRQRSELAAQAALETDYIPLQSVFGLDYRPLRDCLAIGNWQEANEETWSIVFRLCSPGTQTWLNLEHIRNFPCLDLQTIDRLWQRHSQGLFGFSVQARIWREIWQQVRQPKGMTELYAARTKAWDRFGDCVGWRVKQRWLLEQEIQFKQEGKPLGYLPIGLTRRTNQAALRKFLWTDLFARIEMCGL